MIQVFSTEQDRDLLVYSVKHVHLAYRDCSEETSPVGLGLA